MAEDRLKRAVDYAALLTMVSAGQRKPFHELLAEYLSLPPTPDAIQEYANRRPDRYIQALMMLAPLAGYERNTTQPIGDINIWMQVQNLGDVQLDALLSMRLDALRQKLAALTTQDQIGQNALTEQVEHKATPPQLDITPQSITTVDSDTE